VLDRLEVSVMFNHTWFLDGKFTSFWTFFNKYNVKSEQQFES